MPLYDNDKPGHCCLCGKRHRWGLCQACMRDWRREGKLPAWLVALRRSNQKEYKRQQRNRGRMGRAVGPTPHKRGPSYATGLQFVSLDQLREANSPLLASVI